MPAPLSAIPVHLITGFLGSGKSSLIRRLIEQKPAEERWAVVINEFGRVGIDQAMFEERDDLVVKGLPGGCLCCQLAFVLQASLVNLLHRYRPDRLIIEPSGLGHPAGLIEVLRGEGLAEALAVRDVITLLDPRRLDDPRARAHETFRDQLVMADGVALTMTDLATSAQVQAAKDWLGELWPQKHWIREAPHGDLSFALLHEGGLHAVGAQAPASPIHRAAREGALHLEQDAAQDAMTAAQEPVPGRPIREERASLGHATLGWRWHAEEVFDLDRLSALLGELPAALRVKGVLHTADGWKLYNRAAGAVTLSGTAWRRDSRLELIGEAGRLPDAEVLEARLAGCLIDR
ncbi:CobW family GTP-binding protein [Halomonas saccharevitans]|uniref:GTPase, G3E family n=1 Tax=Halomonas saccharevitans TaxID=416872 RepID=A0A1I7B2F7_9GAMM|nr:GTP-binding protein [Halomonas saccharevitans]SFT81375.1 GTPase, G3E family [Halomonas saccharevitans]